MNNLEREKTAFELKLIETISILRKALEDQKYTVEIQKQYIEILENELKDRCITYPTNRAKSKHLRII